MRRWLVIALMLMVVPFAGASAQDSARQELTVFAATSLTDVFESLRAAYTEAHPNAEILLNFSSSSTLAAQLIQGAPADVFASANELQMDLVVEMGLIAADAVEIFAHNQLALITPADNPAGIESMRELAGESVLLVLAAEGTPIRAYTDAMLASLNEDYAPDYAERVRRNLVSEESNVRQVVARVALGEADAGIVYKSDTIGDAAERLRAIDIDRAHNQLASYPIAPLVDTANMTLAMSFIEFVVSEAAGLLLEAYGFCPPAILSEVSITGPGLEPTLEADAADEDSRASCPQPEAVGG